MLDFLSNLPRRVRIVEVGPRDGLQNESTIVAAADKIHYVEVLAEAGLADVEVTSFVSPKRVPQLADAAEVFAGIRARPGTRYSALVPNLRGLERAIEAGVRAVALFTAASETFAERNIGMSIGESLVEFGKIVAEARTHHMWVRAYISTAFVCPFEGPIAPDRVAAVVAPLVEIGVDEVSLGDTIGHAVPTDVVRLAERLAPILPLSMTAYHFHDTRGAALANVLAAMQCGASIFDSASGGAGGCPFAPGAAGNLATEDLLSLLIGMGIETGVELDRVVEASRFLESRLGRPLPGKYLQAAQRSAMV